MDKSLSVSLLIEGNLNSSFKRAFGTFKQSLNDVNGALKRLEADQRRVDTFAALKKSIGETEKKLQSTQNEIGKLAREIKSTSNPSKALINNFENAKRKASLLKQQFNQQRIALHQLRGELDRSGVSTRNLVTDQQKLRAAIRNTRTAQERLTRALRTKEGLSTQRREIAGQAIEMTALALAIRQALRPSIDFQAAMKDVEKVVDGDAEAFARLEQQLKSMTGQIPLTAGELAQIAAAGGRLGLTINDLPDFVAVVAKMSVAFDLLPEAAGEAIAKLSNVFDIPIKDIERLGDAINQLANNTAAKESDIVKVLLRVGGAAKQFGLTAQETAALADAFLALGRGPEIAGTAINALLARLQAAEGQAKSFHDGLARLNTDATTLADNIEANPQRALVEFLGTMEKLDKRTRALVLTDLFGQEYADDIAILVGSLGEYRKALGLIADESEYLGGVNQEFNKRLEATQEQLTLMGNAATKLKINFGNTLLPTINVMIEALTEFLNLLADGVEEFPEVSAALALLVAGGVSAKAVALIWKLFSYVIKTAGANATIAAAKLPLVSAALNTLGITAAGANGKILPLLANLRVLAALGAAGIAIAIAFKIKGDLDEATARLKHYMKIRADANAEADALVKTNKAYADTQILAADAVGQLSSAELTSYRERLSAARQYYLGLARQDMLLNSDGSLTELVNRNKAIAQSYWDAIQQLAPALELREQQEELHGKRIVAIKQVVTEDIRDELAKQLSLEEKATKDLAKAQADRLRIAQEFKSLIESLTTPKQKPVEDATVLDLNRLRDHLRSNIDAGNFESAIKNAERAKAIIEALANQEKASNGYLATQAKLVAKLADEAAKGREGQAKEKVDAARASIDRLKAEAEALKKLDIGFNMELAKQAAVDVVALIREELKNANLTVEVTPILTKSQKDANKELNIEGFQEGGWIPGFGGGDRWPILTEGGEHITRKERARPFASLLNIINRGTESQVARLRELLSGNLRGFRTGGFNGLTPPMSPSFDASMISTLSPTQTGHPVYLSIGGQEIQLSGNNQQVQDLEYAVHMANLKSGSRR